MTGVLEGLRAALAGRYHVEHELGHGAMATVYLAHDLRLNRRVAVKVLLPFLSAALGAERFLREISIVAGFNHPNILPLFDSGELGGLVYYVMPYVEGESLHDRLQRERQLPVPEALSITRQILDGLGYAHAQGIVHRDVKPANIMLAGDRAMVADFGIARAIRRAANEERLTETGIALGTPAYMSPEQAGAESALDGRSDLYAAGCVLYEMLTGHPPFTGPTAQAILARHQLDPVPPIRTVRRTVSVEVEHAVLRALEKVPADRYATASEFTGALDARPALPQPEPGSWPRRVSWLAGFVAAGVVLYLAIKGMVSAGIGGAAGLDTTRYAILPFERDSGLASINEDQLLQDAMLQWTGITVVDRPSLQNALSGHAARLTSSDVEGVAQRVGAGRYVLSQVSRIGDSLRIHSAVYSATARGPPVHEGTVKVGRNFLQTGSAFSEIADQLLFGEARQGTRLDRPTGTTSRPARQAFALGLDSVHSWNLTAADSAFNAATRYDPGYAQAHLWLAQVRFWGDTVLATWRSSAERAAAGGTSLSHRDRLLSDALLAFGRGEVKAACEMWQEFTARVQYDFSGWYGLATCLSQDEAVLRDPRASSGWRFRSSYYRATKAYQRAFQLIPALHKAMGADSYSSVRRLLMTGGSELRPGRAVPPDTTTFAAYPAWQGETLAFIPYPLQHFVSSKVVPEGMSLAVRRERELFHDIATSWVTAFPKSADAVWALAISLELLGDPAALDTLRRARALMTTPEGRVRAAGAEVWMRVKFSIPSDLAGLRTARAIADSLLRANSPPRAQEPLLLASLAALTGRATLAAQLSRHPAVVDDWGVPSPLVKTAGPLLAFAALGGPVDSLRELEQQTDSAIARHLPLPLRQAARMRWLARPATLAFPEYRFGSVGKLAGGGNYLVDAEAAFHRGDTATLRRVLAHVRDARRFALPGDVTLDALYPEAWLLAAVNDPVAAMAWLDPTLTALENTAPEKLVDLANAGALVKAMALRAELAEGRGETATAARWARAVIVLWSDADPFLQPLVRRMERLAR